MPMQNHLHLSQTLGGSPENAPDLKWPAYDRLPVPYVNLNMRRAQNGVLHVNDLQRSGNTVQLLNFNYVLALRDYDGVDLTTRFAYLQAMQGQAVYLVDHEHADNGDDHTSDVRLMVLEYVGPYEKIDTALTHYRVEIKLIDHSLT